MQLKSMQNQGYWLEKWSILIKCEEKMFELFLVVNHKRYCSINFIFTFIFSFWNILIVEII
jgi:hypothetical protein